MATHTAKAAEVPRTQISWPAPDPKLYLAGVAAPALTESDRAGMVKHHESLKPEARRGYLEKLALRGIPHAFLDELSGELRY